MKHRIYILSLYTLLLASVLLTGCVQDPLGERGGTSQYRTVTVTLPPLVAANVTTTLQTRNTSGKSVQQAAGHSLFTIVSSCVEKGVAVQPATRASHPEYTNVWLLQFGSDGTKLKAENIGTIAANASITAEVVVAENCTFYVVTNGPATGLNPANLTAFEAMDIAPADVTQPCLTASLSGVSVEEYNGVARLVSADGLPLVFPLLSVTPTFSAFANIFIPGWTITGMELYNVPKTSPYKGATTSSDPAATAANFDYTDQTAAGKPLACTTTSNGSVSGTWYIPANLQGEVESITKESDRNHANSPTFATFIRVRATNSDATATATFDVYPGEGLTGFDLQRNHTYSLFIAIDGTEEDLNRYAQNDDRVTMNPNTI